jgi:hypothetical protein
LEYRNWSQTFQEEREEHLYFWRKEKMRSELMEEIPATLTRVLARNEASQLTFNTQNNIKKSLCDTIRED